MLSRVSAAFFAGALIAASDVARCNDYPSRPIRVLVASAPGGASDVAARLAAEALGRALNNPVFVEIRGGGGGGGLQTITSFVAGEPDGYTILLAAVGAFSIIPAGKRVPYDVEKDFVPLGAVWRSAQALAVRPSSDATTLTRFVADARARPGTLTIASAGAGTVTHLAIELLKREAGIDVIEAGIDVIHVPFRGAGEALPAVVGGQIDAVFSDIGVIAPQVNGGNARALAVTAERRVPALPDVPTMGEAGLPGVTGEVWFGFVVAAKTPPAVVRRLQEALAATHDDPVYKEQLARQHASAGERGPESLTRLIRSETAKWRAVVTEAGIRLD